MTLGFPLAVSAIRRALRPLRRPVTVEDWFNVMDRRDIVSLYPLDPEHLGLDDIENRTDVENRTPNRHGITGHLDDAVVARRVHDALVTAP